MGMSQCTSDKLRQATSEQHHRLQETEFAQAILAREVDLTAYIGYIRVLAIIHAALEKGLDSCEHSLVRQVWSDDLRRLPELLEDNDYYRYQLIPDAPAANQAALQAASHILRLSGENPIALLGCLYVLAGSTKGAQILAPRISQALQLAPGQGLSYLSRHCDPGVAEWQQASSRLDQAVTDSGSIQILTQAAQELFQYLEQAFNALWPLKQESMQFTAGALNPEAGNHPVPQDREDMVAVLRASDRSLAELPYYMYRFGDRGRRFADTDGSWLTTLPETCPQSMGQQLDWLGGVLSNRGIPKLLLARHMEILAQELAAAKPALLQRSRSLQQEAARLRTRMSLCFSRQELLNLSRVLALRLNRDKDYACWEAINLLAAAASDQAEGISGSMQSLLSWLADPVHFPQPWVQAIKDMSLQMQEKHGTG